ncbi:MAG: hypothetical protein AABX38_06220 [Candidatus Micrarchaeota archaeon]
MEIIKKISEKIRALSAWSERNNANIAKLFIFLSSVCAVAYLLLLALAIYNFSILYRIGRLDIVPNLPQYILFLIFGVLVLMLYLANYASQHKIFSKINVVKCIVAFLFLYCMVFFLSPYIFPSFMPKFSLNAYFYPQPDINIVLTCYPSYSHFVVNSQIICDTNLSRVLKNNESLFFYIYGYGKDISGAINGSKISIYLSKTAAKNLPINATFSYYNSTESKYNKIATEISTDYVTIDVLSEDEYKKIMDENVSKFVGFITFIFAVLFFGVNQLWEVIFKKLN